MRMLRRLAGARRPDHGDATHGGHTAVDAAEHAAERSTVTEPDDDVTGHLRRQAPTTAPSGAEVPIPTELLAPIAGVSVDQYVAVCARLAAHRYDPSCIPTITSEAGIDTAAWDVAAAGFNARVSASAAFARHFNTRYRAALDRAS